MVDETAWSDVGNPADLARRAAQRDPEGLALVDGALRLTWRELDERVDAVAAGLRARGLAEGDRVALQTASGAAFATGYLGTIRAGMISVPIDPSYTEAEVRHILDDSGAALLLDGDAVPEPETTTSAAVGAAALDSTRRGEDVVAVLYTSGTSGRGKGAMLSARALLANTEQVAAVRPPLVAAGDVVFLPVPLSHILGLNAGLGTALLTGATLVLAGSGSRFDPDATLTVMAAERVTTVLAVPGHYAAWLARPGFAAGFGTVRFAMSGSTRLGRGLVDGYAQAGVALRDGYGLTETAPVVTLGTPDDDAVEAAGSVGRPVPGVQVQLRDTDGDEVDDGDPGRLHVRGPNLFSGYWPDGRDGPDADGWFATGDIALTDPAGRLRLVGRTTDLVIVNGFNVYPAEVETVLVRFRGVAEAAVIGVGDERTGEAVHAFVVPAAGERIDPAELTAQAARVLARFKVPSEIHVVDALPHTVTGKVKKWQLDPTGADDRGSE